MTAHLRRLTALALTLVAATAIAVTPPGAAMAEPNGSPTADEDGGDPLLSEVLDRAGRGYLEAKSAYQNSRKRQLELSLEVRQAQAKLDELTPQVGVMAAESYRMGKLNSFGALLNSSSPDSFLDRAVKLNEMNLVNDQKLRALNAALDRVNRAKSALDREVKEEQKQLRAMDQQQKSAEKALALVGGKSLTGGFVDATSRKAKPAPRTANGGWPGESCSEPDPTTSGCVTPRTLHMYNEVRKAGFTRFVGCHRNGGPFEHPKGRACDWSLIKKGFRTAANADERKYGNDLMAFLVRNADALGILYVIWYKQIWFPGRGWKSYSGPSAHTDHVHVSML